MRKLMLFAFVGTTLARSAAFAQSPPFGGHSCGLKVTASNAARHVYGAVEAECTDSCSPFVHSFPFGNWGLVSFHGGSYDGGQFKGWSTYNSRCGESMDDPEWNSCTTDLSLTLNRSAFWNYNNNTEQYSGDESQYGEQYIWLTTSEDEGCARYNNAQLSFGGDFVDVYELDTNPFGNDHDFITSLQINAQTATILVCSREGCNPAESDWVASEPNDIMTALWKYRLSNYCLYIEGKGCS